MVFYDSIIYARFQYIIYFSPRERGHDYVADLLLEKEEPGAVTR